MDARRTASEADPDTILLVDDDAGLAKTLRCQLGPSFRVEERRTAADAIERIERGGVTVVVTNTEIPGMNGFELLGAIRLHDPDLPIVLVTAVPSIASATKSLEYGVAGYLRKPLDPQLLCSTLAQSAQLYRLARMKREALALLKTPELGDLLAIERGLSKAFASLWMAFQPIVSASRRVAFGYEALMRTKGGRMRAPAQILDAAERLDKVQDLGRLVRERAAALMAAAPPDCLLFLNLHPAELSDPKLLDPNSSLSAIAHRVVLEITERATLEPVERVIPRIAALREMGFKIAIDDLGAGYAGLSSFALLEPEFVKVDMSLTRGIDQSRVKQRIVASIIQLCREMGITVVVEGVETVEERDALLALGTDLLQGFLFARPGRPFPEPTW